MPWSAMKAVISRRPLHSGQVKTSMALSALPVVGMHPDPGVERVPLQEGASTRLAKQGVTIPEEQLVAQLLAGVGP
jgi:hypothetical protein